MSQRMLVNGMERQLFMDYINQNFGELYQGGGSGGSGWYDGEGAPTDTHMNGDYYLNTTNGDVYRQENNALVS